MKVVIENKEYQVEKNEFSKLFIEKYCNLNMFYDLGEFERLIGLITDLSKDLDIPNVLHINPTHGSFIPINCSSTIQNNTIAFLKDSQSPSQNKPYKTYNETYNDRINEHIHNTKTNINHLNIKNITVIEPTNKNENHPNIQQLNILQKMNINEKYIIVADHLDNTIIDMLNKNNKTIVITNKNKQLETIYTNWFYLTNTNKVVYVPKNQLYSFYTHFKYYIKLNETKSSDETNSNEPIYELEYENLINLCIMVKNGGEQFEQMLRDNFDLIDRWTILDTGSTDNTIDIIKKVLVETKKGQLYQEPFINFKDSRNRLLDLAGDSCKYTLMLDDTYVIKGQLRQFLNTVRSDQFSDSFSLYIKSDDVEYGSNRILKTNRKLRYWYRIHEVIQSDNNNNVIVPLIDSNIFDGRFEYMENRTMDRKLLDIKLLFEELTDDPDNPRTHYYLGQTYNLLNDHKSAFKWMMERVNHKNEGFQQEKVDACFEAARIADFKLNKPWEEVEPIYKRAYELDKERPDSLYFLGIHYYLEGNMKVAYDYFKKGFEIGYPLHKQYGLKPTLSFHFLPKFLARICYQLEDYKTGEECSKLFLQHNKPGDDAYEEIVSWYLIYQKLNIFPKRQLPILYDTKEEIPRMVFVADGGFEPWSGSSILKKGVGGSETYIIEMARYIQQSGQYEVIVFCNCEEKEVFEGVTYMPLNEFYMFVNSYMVNTCIVSRYSEYLPVAFKGYVDNVYLVVHDLTPSGIVIPIDPKLKKIFCLTEWHVEHMTKHFPSLKHLLEPFYYGIDFSKFKLEDSKPIEKVPYKFIYSSFPNRGLYPLLQMWPLIHKAQPKASLHIFSDIDGKWVNNVAADHMNLIRGLLETYKKEDANQYNIHSYGWVNKKTLADAWLSSDIWFYPCIFMETFCLTALEAATTKTLAITNDLAALQNTVGDRGVVIKGDPMTVEWQTEAVSKVIEYMNMNEGIHNQTRKQEFIDKNYKWASTLSWKNQALKLLNEYIMPKTFDYRGMYNWTNDLPPGNKQYFLDAISYFNENYVSQIKHRQIRVLEVGVYAGVSLIHILNLIPNSIGMAIDKWENYTETTDSENYLLKNMENHNVEESFYKNVENAEMKHRIIARKGDSFNTLMSLHKVLNKEDLFDFIYVDGSHLLLDSYVDILLSWKILNKGGVLAIDDVTYNTHFSNKTLESPFVGVNYFLETYKGQYKLLSYNYRVFLQKLVD
jgi:predicted O-methyltransferase YrrM